MFDPSNNKAEEIVCLVIQYFDIDININININIDINIDILILISSSLLSMLLVLCDKCP